VILTKAMCELNIDRAVRGAAMLAQMAKQPFDAEKYRNNFYVGIDDNGHWKVAMRAQFIADNLGWPLEYAKSWKQEKGDPEEPPQTVKLHAW
jgi:hypothetical protein